MHIESWKEVYWWSNKKKQFYCWIISFPCLFCFMKLNGICSTWLNDGAFSFFLEWMTCLFTAKEVEGTITAEEALKCTYKLIFKQKLKEIREWGLFTERVGRAANPRHLQILRVDRERMIDDVICAKKTLWIRSSWIFVVTQNARKRCCWHCNIVTLLLISKLHTGVCEEMFKVNIKTIIIQTSKNIWNFNIVGKSSLQEMANFQRLSRRFHTLIWRPGDTVQNLESPSW